MSQAAIILAAGKSTRMNSAQVKVLHEVCGRPMLAWVLDAVRATAVARIVVVVGHGHDRVRRAFAGQADIQWVRQSEPKGTGHAVAVCRAALESFAGDVFVLAGDGPLVRPQTLRAMLAKHQASGAALTLATSRLENPHGYGRILRDSAGEVIGIVEEKDATAQQRRITEVNPSYYLFQARALFSAVEKIAPNNLKGEYYLTDAVGILGGQGLKVVAVPDVAPEDVLSINSRAELGAVNQILQRRLQQALSEAGVTLVAPLNTWIEFGAEIGQDTVLEPFTWIGRGAHVKAKSHVPAGTVIARGGCWPRRGGRRSGRT